MKIIFAALIMIFLSPSFFLYGDKLVFASTSNKTSISEEIENKERQISKLLRCVVCQNQSIYESNADIAYDMSCLLYTSPSPRD